MIMLFHLRFARRSGHRDIGASNDINNITSNSNSTNSILFLSPVLAVQFQFIFSNFYSQLSSNLSAAAAASV